MSENVVMLASTQNDAVKLASPQTASAPVHRNTRKLSSSAELSLHARSIRVCETAAAVRFAGAAGGTFDHALASLDAVEYPPSFTASTRYECCTAGLSPASR